MRQLILLFLLSASVTVHAQVTDPIVIRTAGMKAIPGYLNVWWDEANGRLYLGIDKWDQELLYTVSLPAGLGSNDIGLDRGLNGGGSVVKFHRVGKKVFVVQPNYEYRAMTMDANERRDVEQSFAQSTLWGFPVLAESGNQVLVDATPFLLRDAMQVGTRLRRMQQGAYSLDSGRSAIYMPTTRSFPLNTELEATVTLVNTDGAPGSEVSSVAPNAGAITLRMHHSFVQLPDDHYKPRVFDARSSFIPISYFDYATPVAEPIVKYMVMRHRLEKKDPSAAKSEAVKPIVYYLDNGTPEPIRSALLEGASWWNQAFEAAGFINAFQVKVLPDTADPMDIRYNMINWVHRSTRGWSYGAAVVDPRTGEIIKGQVSLGSLRVRQDYLIAQGLLAPFENGLPADDKMLKMALERLRQLSAHEVGHTLGLMHNYASSVNDRASVMDYPHPLVHLDGSGNVDMSAAYAKGIGEWDKVAISWGYGDFGPGKDEAKELDHIMDDASTRGLQFISDRDARAPGGPHPQAHLWDNGRDAATELKEVVKVREKALKQFGENSIRPGVPMAFLEDVLVPVYLYHRYQVEAACKVVGGQDYSYALNREHMKVTEPISKERQAAAMDVIMATLTPAFLEVPDRIVKLIPPRPAGYEFTRELFKKRTGLTFDPLAPAETAADLPLSFLFHPERTSRLSQAPAGSYTLHDMIRRVEDGTWKAPRETGSRALIQQQTEQIVLTYMLAATVDETASFAARAVARKELDDLKTWIESKKKATTDESLSGHYALALERMKAPEKAKPTQHAAIPPGAPIGDEE